MLPALSHYSVSLLLLLAQGPSAPVRAPAEPVPLGQPSNPAPGPLVAPAGQGSDDGLVTSVEPVPSLGVTFILAPAPSASSSQLFRVSDVSIALPTGHLNAPPPPSLWSRLLPDLDAIKAWGPVIVGILTIVFVFWHQSRHLAFEKQKHQSEMDRDAAERELAAIAQKLDSFYGPFKQLRAESQLLYRYFALREKADALKRGEPFRTLTWLADKKPLEDADKELLDAILRIGTSLLKLIERQTGVVDKPVLQDLLGKYAAHIRLLKLARDGKLTAPSTALAEIVFPRAIDGAIESAVLRLQDRQRELTRASASLPEAQDVSLGAPAIEYYNEHAEAYAARTMSLNLGELYDKFLSDLPAGARILDAGCGPGRDTRAFIQRGYRVVSIDASSGMVDKCREYPHAYCLRMDLRELTFKEEFDGAWACAVLLHMNGEDAERATQRLVTALKPGGYLFLSLKQGKGCSTATDGRTFYYYDEAMVGSLFASDPRLETSGMIWTSKGLNETSPDETWVNGLFRRAREPGV